MAATSSLTGITTENKLDIKSFLDLILPSSVMNPPTEGQVRALFAEYLSGIVRISFPRPIGKKNARIHVFIQFTSAQFAKKVRRACAPNNWTSWGWLVGLPDPKWFEALSASSLIASSSTQEYPRPSLPSAGSANNPIPMYDGSSGTRKGLPEIEHGSTKGVATKSIAAMAAASTFLLPPMPTSTSTYAPSPNSTSGAAASSYSPLNDSYIHPPSQSWLTDYRILPRLPIKSATVAATAPSESQTTGSKSVPNRTTKPTVQSGQNSFSSPMLPRSSPPFLPEELQCTVACSPQGVPVEYVPTAVKPSLRSLDTCPPSMDILLKLFPDHVPPSHRERIIGIPLKRSDAHRRILLGTLEDLSQQSDGGFILFIKDLDTIERFHPVKRSLPDEFIDYSPSPSSSRSRSPLPGSKDEKPSLIIRQLNKRRACSSY